MLSYMDLAVAIASGVQHWVGSISVNENEAGTSQGKEKWKIPQLMTAYEEPRNYF